MRSGITRREFCSEVLATSILAAAGAAVPMFVGAKDLSKANPHSKLIDDKDDYTLSDYKNDVLTLGLAKTWENICEKVFADGETENGLLRVSNFGELYEIGLALQDKNAKKNNGQYFTPPDVCRVMSEWLCRLDGDSICDVACGVGNLILDYFDFIGRDRAIEIIKSGKLHLYDIDETALMICAKSIAIRYGAEIEKYINIHQGDFLDASVKLPLDCKVISNPPYATFTDIPDSWLASPVIRDSKELYSAFMEKIIRQSRASVIISPYSFIGGAKFYSLRRVMNDYNGFVVSFDNVPGTIFCGRKHGIFNSNTGNAVRAAITVVENNEGDRGFRFGPLIRFKATERDRLLKCDVLESFVGEERQKVDNSKQMFAKCDRRLDAVFKAWNIVSDKPLGLYLNNEIGKYEMYIPNTCRYFTTASVKKLPRSGQIELRFSDEDVFNYVFCMVNSSFAYWHWRLYDGGITYAKGLLHQMPLFFARLDSSDKSFFKATALEMISRAHEFVVTKNNVGLQENIKYPREYRDKINTRLLKILGVKDDPRIFDIVHSNMALEVNV